MLRWTLLVSALSGLAWSETAGALEDRPRPPQSPILAPSPADKNKYTFVNKQSVKLESVNVKERTIKVSYKARTTDKTDEIAVADDCKFRSLHLPETVDENGKFKKPTPEEIRKLKGSDPKLPGYAVEFAALAAGQQIEVTVSRIRDKAPRKKDKTAPAEKEAVLATLIVILHDDRAQQPGKPVKR